MQIFNTLLDVTRADDAELANRAHFGLRYALAVLRLGARPELASELISHWDRTCDEVPRRLASWGVDAGVCLGVSASNAPMRAHDAVWDALELRARRPDVWALGPVRVRSQPQDGLEDSGALAIAARMLEVGAGSTLPVIAHVSGPASRAEVGLVLREAHAAGLDPSRLVIAGVDFTSLRTVLDAGVHACALVGAGETEVVAQLVVRFGERARRRLMLGTAGAIGRPDVLALAKVGRAFSEHGLSAQESAPVLAQNAHRLFRRDR